MTPELRLHARGYPGSLDRLGLSKPCVRSRSGRAAGTPAADGALSRMRQDKLTGSLRRGGRCLKRQGGGGGGGVGTILSNVLKKRSCISRTAPRLLCTLEPGEARAAIGRWVAGVCGALSAWEGWEQTPPGCVQQPLGHREPAARQKLSRGLCTVGE